MVIRPTIPAGFLVFLIASSLPSRAQGIPEKFTNLQVLPTNIARQDLLSQMRGFVFSLGVRCDYCHAGKNGPDLKEMDFASDAKKEKVTARTMIRMTQEINRTYIANISKPPETVECVTCHRGSPHPRTLQVVLAREMEQNGVNSAVAMYRQLRKENYGNGQYDFSERSFRIVAQG
jgi:hypothetical protein